MLGVLTLEMYLCKYFHWVPLGALVAAQPADDTARRRHLTTVAWKCIGTWVD